jgi:hypothetical protein
MLGYFLIWYKYVMYLFILTKNDLASFGVIFSQARLITLIMYVHMYTVAWLRVKTFFLKSV